MFKVGVTGVGFAQGVDGEEEKFPRIETSDSEAQKILVREPRRNR